MAELVDALALGACGETRGGSSPLPPTIPISNRLLKKLEWMRPSTCFVKTREPRDRIKCFTFYAAVIQLVECHLAKVDAKGSNPFRRFKEFLLIFWRFYENY